jgi:hypothetical protein
VLIAKWFPAFPHGSYLVLRYNGGQFFRPSDEATSVVVRAGILSRKLRLGAQLAVFWGNVVDPGPAPRVTPPNTPCSQPNPFQRTVLIERLKRIGGTGRVISAIEADPWTKDQPIRTHWEGNDMRKRAHVACRSFKAVSRSWQSWSNGRDAVVSRLPIRT